MAKPLADKLDKHIACRLKKIRQQRGVSAMTLAEAIDSTQQQISRYENGNNKLSATQLYRISEALGISISWFFQGYEDEAPIRSLGEPPANYEVSQIKEEIDVVNALWPSLNAEQRASVIRLIEVMQRN